MKKHLMTAASAASIAAMVLMAASSPAEARWGWGGGWHGGGRVGTVVGDGAQRRSAQG